MQGDSTSSNLSRFSLKVWLANASHIANVDANQLQRDFRRACELASSNPDKAYKALLALVGSGTGDGARCCASELLLLCELADVLLTRPVGRLGSRPFLRITALKLLDYVLEKEPELPRALCLKGLALLGYQHGGYFGAGCGDVDIHSGVGCAFVLFTKAADQNYGLGMFLKGRLLITTTVQHGDPSHAIIGFELVRRAAEEKDIAEAYVLMATVYEYPDKYLPAKFDDLNHLSDTERETAILGFYQLAANLGHAAAFNDLGASVVQGYAGLEPDFEKARSFYARSAKGGYPDAFENLGRLYETGCSGHAPEKIDLKKALKMYRAGASLHSAHSMHYLAQTYDEGSGVLEMNKNEAEKCYKRALLCSDDAYDANTGSAVVRDLVRFYITRIKTNLPGSDLVCSAMHQLEELLGKDCLSSMMETVEKQMMIAIRDRRKKPLEELVHARNVGHILQFCRVAINQKSQTTKKSTLLKHLLGRYVKAITSGSNASKSNLLRTCLFQ